MQCGLLRQRPGVRYLVVTVVPTGMPGLGDYLNRYCLQQYQPRQDAGG